MPQGSCADCAHFNLRHHAHGINCKGDAQPYARLSSDLGAGLAIAVAVARQSDAGGTTDKHVVDNLRYMLRTLWRLLLQVQP